MAAIDRPLPQQRRGAPLPFGFGPINWWAVAAVAVLGIGAMLPVLQRSSATTRGFDVQRIQAEQAQVSGDIRQLESEVASLTSLNRIEGRATELGLVPGTDPLFVNVGVPGPAPAKVPSTYLPGPTPATEQPESWYRSLFRWAAIWD
jgi:hypothetical protein